jgi:hypothetical protein
MKQRPDKHGRFYSYESDRYNWINPVIPAPEWLPHQMKPIFDSDFVAYTCR